MMPPPKPEFPPLLPPGFYPMSLADMRGRCVDAFPLSQTRSAIMEGLTTVVQRLIYVGVVGHLWTDGSFLTQKIDPEDVDLLLRISAEFWENATDQQREAIGWFAREDLKTLYHCDCYVWVELPCDDPAYMESEWRRAYWIRQFGFSRRDETKGIAVIELSGDAP
jgi:hypothetical protein